MIAVDIRLRVALLFCPLTLWLAFAASCKDDAFDNDSDPTELTPNDVGYPFAYIARPTGAAGFTTTETSVTLGGPGLGENEGSGCIQTEEPAHSYDWGQGGRYGADIVQERLIVWMANPTTPGYVITPRFIEHYVAFDRAIVVNSACYGLSDIQAVTPLHKAFVKTAGAAVYIGFTGKVGIVYGGNWVKAFSASMAAGQTVSEAFLAASANAGPFDPARPSVAPIIIANAPGDENLTISWDCDGYIRVSTMGPTAGGVYQAYQRITQGAPGDLHAVETRAKCLYSQAHTWELPGGVTIHESASSSGEWRGELEEPYPRILSVAPGNAAINFYDGTQPPSDDWVVKIVSGTGAQPLVSFGRCEIHPPDGFINDGTNVTITDTAIEGAVNLPVENGSFLVEFKYELDRQTD